MKYTLLVLSVLLSYLNFSAQAHFNTNGVHSKNKPNHVFTNATLHLTGGTIVEKGMLIIRENKIIYSGNKTKIPENSIVEDLEGKHIYPSFIDLNSNFGIQKKEKKRSNRGPQYSTNKVGPYYWNQAVQPENNAFDVFKYDNEKAKGYIKDGFGLVLSNTNDGIVRGTGTLIALSEDDNLQVIDKRLSQHFSFQKGTSTQAYPSSHMGAIALLRQYYFDLEYYKNNQESEPLNLSLSSGIENHELKEFFDVKNRLAMLRAQRIQKEFNTHYIYIGNGDEYQAINELQILTNYVIPLNFPKSYEVEDPYDALYVTLEELKHWEMAPSNPFLLREKGMTFAITRSKLDKKASFLNNLKKSVEKGLSKEYAIEALTSVPAAILGMQDKIGSLNEGCIANFIICDQDIFEEGSNILENWVQGKKNTLKNTDVVDIRGNYNLNVNQIIRTLSIKGSAEKPKGKLEYNMIVDSISESGDLVIDKVTGKPIKVTQKKSIPVTISTENNYISFSYNLSEGPYRLSGNINFDSGSWDGKGQGSDGQWFDWTAIRKEKPKQKKENESLASVDTVRSKKFNFPQMAYGWDTLPEQVPILIKGATVWTLESEGTIVSDVLIRDGKIAAIAKILDVVDKNGIVIDGTGMHLTPGIIDEHSHIAIDRGVNEGSHAVTAEVCIGDVVKNNDVNIYRQLAGGVTACQLLHGSANPIGGRSGMIKLRWGYSPEKMRIKDADGFIKFALGENVKQSNWGDYNTIRFPQTRMGVEQVYYDAFIRAREYESKWLAFEKASSNKKSKFDAKTPKRDIQMDAVLEIINKERFVTCHSYVQSEINMLMHVADSMGFTLNTFTHILEGYKVADKMKEHGAGGSTFSDWWAYKYEVNDAIPYNASLMNEMGILTAINSDDAEMGRRLNQEAAKGIKYGGMSEEEALKMVTLNPAKLLHLEDRMGSIKVGKDADVVLWTDHPLSIYAQVEKTIVDGIVFYDSKRDLLLTKEIQEEKLRIIKKMMNTEDNGEGKQKVKAKKQRTHICTSVDESEF